jgi:nucleoside-diphosphate-sugar epimerase
VEGTVNLATQAAEAGVKRFIYISSVKVNGEFTENNKPFTDLDIPNPQDFYAVSKYEAELELTRISTESDMELVIIRPPLIYGSGVKANFASLARLVRSGIPLPLGMIGNKRSFVALENLIDFIITCVDHPLAANQTFLISDGCDLSTTELVKKMALTAGVNTYLLPIPMSVLYVCAWVVGRHAFTQRLCGNLQLDITKARNLLGWVPPISVDEALKSAMLL